MAFIQHIPSNCHAQQNTINDKNVLLYFMKVNNYSLDDQFFVSYLKITKQREFNLYQNDEFGYSKFYNSSKTEYSNDLANLDFTTRFVITKIIDIGGYDFQKKSFPLFIEYSEYFGQLNPTSRLPYNKNISAEVFNSSYIQKELKMSEVNADALIQKRKSSNGAVNRKFLSKVEYSVMNLKNQVDPNILILYIHKISIYDGSGIIQIITPNEDYYDKVNGLKLKDGTEKIFFDANWKILPKENSSAASYYRIVNYKDGKIDNPVIDYFISGAKQMIGNYPVNLQTKYGLFQFFYENGQKSQEATYAYDKVNGKYQSWYPNSQKSQEATYAYDILNGKYQSWYSNGDKKEEVNYIYGKKDGCDYMWVEDGRCLKHEGLIAEWTYTNDYFSYYENGKVIDNSKVCPCFKRNAPPPLNSSYKETGQTNEESKSLTTTHKGHFYSVLNGLKYQSFQMVNFRQKGIGLSGCTVQEKGINSNKDWIVKQKDSLFLSLSLNDYNLKFLQYKTSFMGKSTGSGICLVSVQIEDSDGKEYLSKEFEKEIRTSRDGYVASGFDISIKINTEELLTIPSSEKLFLSFYIRSKNDQNLLLEGYAPFKLE